MTVSETIELFKAKYPIDEDITDVQLEQTAVNCISLAQAWMDKIPDESVNLSTYGDDETIIESVYGATIDNLPIELMNICLNHSDKVNVVRVFHLTNKNGKMESELIGVLDIA